MAYDIYKLQIPLASSEKTPGCLIYNESRSIMCQLPEHKIPINALRKAIDEGGKCYFRGYVMPELAVMTVVEFLKHQEW